MKYDILILKHANIIHKKTCFKGTFLGDIFQQFSLKILTQDKCQWERNLQYNRS